MFFLLELYIYFPTKMNKYLIIFLNITHNFFSVYLFSEEELFFLLLLLCSFSLFSTRLIFPPSPDTLKTSLAAAAVCFT